MAEGLWPFSLRFYDDPGAQAACLRLQDEFGGDVNMVLWLLWRASRGDVIGLDGVAALDAAGRPWREEVVRPLRALRRRLKEGSLGAEAEAQESFRSRVKKIELDAEKLQQQVLEAAEVPVAGTAPTIEAAARNLAAYGSKLSAPMPDDLVDAFTERLQAVI